MNESARPTGVRIVQFLSKLLMVLGACVFVLGDKFLDEFAHFHFVTGEVVGILSGLLLCAVGFAIGASVSGGKGW
jgi:hypothetical protein